MSTCQWARACEILCMHVYSAPGESIFSKSKHPRSWNHNLRQTNRRTQMTAVIEKCSSQDTCSK